MGDKNVVAAGKPVINDRLGSLELEISPASFYQVNPVQMKRLYDKVREYCGFGRPDEFRDMAAPDPDNPAAGPETEAAASATAPNDDLAPGGSKPVVLDIYCGVGTIGLYCADEAEAVVGIESVKEAVIDANRNAVINGIVNARYICGRAEEVLPACVKAAGKTDGDTAAVDEELAAQIRRADIAILDPPRAGCSPELLEAVASVGVGKIIYVSCDPATLARDVRLLGDLGYEFVEGTPVDMFPHTGHVETVAVLSRKSATKTFIPVTVSPKDMGLDEAKAQPTYENIRKYVKETHGLTVSTLNIAQMKAECGLEMECDRSGGKQQPKCPPEKREAILDAFRHFGMIEDDSSEG